MSGRSRISIAATVFAFAVVCTSSSAFAAALPGQTILAASTSQLAAARQSLGVPALTAQPGACLAPLAFDASNPFPGRADLLVAALAPQTTRLDGCLTADQSGYHSPAADRLVAYPADGSTTVAPGQPLLVFAQGPFVERPATSDPTYAGYWRMRTTVSAARLVRVRDGAAVPLATDDAAFTLYPGWTLTPVGGLAPATSYHAEVTLSSAYGSKTVAWTFQTKGASGVLAGSASSSATKRSSANLSVNGDQLRVSLGRTAQVKLLLRHPDGTWTRASRLLSSTASLSLRELFGSLTSGRYTLRAIAPGVEASLDFDAS